MADWLGRLSAFLPGADQMSEQERMALIREGLLAFGSGTLANNGNNYGKAGPAIGAGLSQGLLAMNKGADQLAENKYKKQYMESQGGDPTQFRAMDMMAKAAGYEPGTDGYKEFFKRANGEIARQSNAAIQYKEVVGSDGIPRMVALDPRAVGAQVVGGGGSAGSYTIDPSLPPEVQAAIRASEQSGQPLPPNIDLAPVLPRRSSGANPFQGRRAEDQAAAVAAAQKAVELGALPTELGMRTNAAIQQAQGVGAANNQVAMDAQNMTRSRDADTAITLLDKAEKLIPQSTGSYVGHMVDEAASATGRATEGAKAVAALQAIAGQLTSRMPRMQGPQSDKDVLLYKQMAGDLGNPLVPRETRLSALQTIRDLQKKYASQQPSAGADLDPLGINP